MIIITEVSSEGTCTGLYDYELLPDNIKEKVNDALHPKFGPLNHRSTEVNIYKDGLQYLYEIKHPQIQPGEIVEYMNNITLYDNEEDEDDEYDGEPYN